MCHSNLRNTDDLKSAVFFRRIGAEDRASHERPHNVTLSSQQYMKLHLKDCLITCLLSNSTTTD